MKKIHASSIQLPHSVTLLCNRAKPKNLDHFSRGRVFGAGSSLIGKRQNYRRKWKNFHMIVRLITKEERLNYNMHQGDVLTIKNEKCQDRVNFAF